MAKQHFSIGRTSLSPDQLSVGNTAAIAGNLAKRAALISRVKTKEAKRAMTAILDEIDRIAPPPDEVV